MIIVPYFHKSIQVKGSLNADILVHSITILCDKGGQALWTENDETLDIEKDCLAANDIICLTKPYRVGATYYAEVDKSATDISSMYTYDEIESGSDILCWRTFIYTTDMMKNPILTVPEQFQNALKDITIRS